MRPWAVAVLALALAASLAAGPVQAQALPADADRDGVADDVDACPDSGLYELVDASGCAVCACEAAAPGADPSARADYLRCVFTEIHARRADGRLTRKAARPFVKAARVSTCGVDKVRCCIMFEGKAEGMCRITDEVRCDASLGADVVDLDVGSCFPNPCVAE